MPGQDAAGGAGPLCEDEGDAGCEAESGMALIENFDQALSHPDQEDLERLRRMITG